MDEFSANGFPTFMDNSERDTTSILHDEDLPTWVDNSAYNMDNGPDYLSPVQYKPFTENTDHIIGEKKPIATLTPLPPDRQPVQTVYEIIPNTKESLEHAEIPTQAAVQTPAIQTSQTATYISGATENHTKNIKKLNGRSEVYRSEELDDEQYLTTDFIDKEQSKTTFEFNELHQLPTAMGNLQHNTQEVLHGEDVPTFINACNIGKSQGYLSPLTYEPVTGKPQTPPPPPGRQTCANMYEEIPEIPEYLEVEEIHTQAGIEPPNPVATTAARDTRRQKRVVVIVTIAILTCISMLVIAVSITYIHPTKNEEGYNVRNITVTQQGNST